MSVSSPSNRCLGTAETISEGLAAVQAWAPDAPEIWFRGHSSASFTLLPSVFRQGPAWGVAIDEAGLFRDFVREFAEMRADHRSEFEWLTLMQHYAIPTRLLDWTTSFLVAIYFAVFERPQEDGVIYVFNPRHFWVESQSNALTPLLTEQIDSHDWQNLVGRLATAARQCLPGTVTINGFDCAKLDSDPLVQGDVMVSAREISSLRHRQKTSKYLNVVTGQLHDEMEQDLTRHLSTVVALRPPKLNARLIAQHGMFTFHGGKFLEGANVISAPPLEDAAGAESLRAIVVPAAAKPRLEQELRRAGIYDAVLFPEMEHKAREIRAQRSRKL